MARAAFLLLAAARIGGDARMPPCPAGVKDDLNWYTTTSGGKVHDCAWLRLDPDTRCNNDGRFLNCPDDPDDEGFEMSGSSSMV